MPSEWTEAPWKWVVKYVCARVRFLLFSRKIPLGPLRIILTSAAISGKTKAHNRTNQRTIMGFTMPVVGVEPTRVISTRDFEFLSASSIWCHPVISSDIWFPLCKGKIHASTNNNLKYPRFFDAFFLYSVFSVWTAQMEIGGMFRRDAGQNAPLLRHKTKGKSRIMNQNQAKEYYKKLFVNYPDVLSVEEATTLLGFKSQTAIIRRIHQHRIRCLKVGRSFMIPKEYLIDYLLDS